MPEEADDMMDVLPYDDICIEKHDNIEHCVVCDDDHYLPVCIGDLT